MATEVHPQGSSSSSSSGGSSSGWSLSSLFSWGSGSSSGKGSSSRHQSGSLRKSGHHHHHHHHHHYPFFGSASGSASVANGKGHARKILCRYGMGCTHVSDPLHRERFWHPPIPGGNDGTIVTVPEYKSSHSSSSSSVTATTTFFPCHECGLGFRHLPNLQLHLQRKTAWSNTSLVGCRISCLIENREWQEGLVLEYAPVTGKHKVAFEHLGQTRWMHMLRAAFFIIRRPVRTSASSATSSTSSRRRSSSSRARRPPLPGSSSSPTSDEGAVDDEEDEEQQQQLLLREDGGETKEWEMDIKGMDLLLAPVEPWTYVEDLSLDYARAQALMHKAYGCKIQETGHKTQGHLCVTEDDRELAKDAQSSLLYGELLPRGINKAMLAARLDGGHASVVYELGMGIGKVAMQVFLQFPTLTRVYGVELSSARFQMAETAVRRLCSENPEDYEVTGGVHGTSIQVTNKATGAILDMEVGNLLEVEGIETADIVLLETDLSAIIYPELCGLLRRMKGGARAFTYLELRKIWCPDSIDAGGGEEKRESASTFFEKGNEDGGAFPFRQLDINRPIADRYATSWSVNRGHHFFLWVKVLESGRDEIAVPPPVGQDPATWAPDEVPALPSPSLGVSDSATAKEGATSGSSSSSSLHARRQHHAALNGCSKDEGSAAATTPALSSSRRRRSSTWQQQQQQGSPSSSSTSASRSSPGRGASTFSLTKAIKKLWRGPSSSSPAHNSNSSSCSPGKLSATATGKRDSNSTKEDDDDEAAAQDQREHNLPEVFVPPLSSLDTPMP